jgi:hypothetical protein
MHLNRQDRAHVLTLDLADAFALQTALTEAIRRMTTLTTEAALRGGLVKCHGVGESGGVMTYTENGRDFPSSLTLHLHVGAP